LQQIAKGLPEAKDKQASKPVDSNEIVAEFEETPTDSDMKGA
jgi:hypothetical protein